MRIRPSIFLTADTHYGGGHRASLKSDVHIDVGVDAIGYKPVPLYEILSKFKETIKRREG